MILTLAFTKAKVQAQTCVGSLGDPVVSETFGAGTNPGSALPDGVTNMLFTPYCPNDGSYTIVNSTDFFDGGNCHPNTWQSVTHDHTGDPNGYMMMINASYNPSVFFTKTTPAVLCQNTTYEFSAYILNMIKVNDAIEPDIEFSIETVDGQVLKQYDTNAIPPSQSANDWVRKSFFFTTLSNTSQVVLKMINNAPGGNGNDLLIDDINFRACGPVIQTGFTSIGSTQPQNQCVGQTVSYTIKTKISDGYTNPQKQWQVNKNDGHGWVDIAGQTGDDYSFTISDNDLDVYQYRIAAAEGSNINSPNCRVFSEPLSVTVNAYPVVPDIAPLVGCEGETLTLSASGGVAFEWSGPGITAANKNQNPIVISPITAANAGTYSIAVTSAAGCTTTKSTTLTVNPKPVITVNTPTATICKGGFATISVTAANVKSYSWTPVTGLSDPTIANPVASPADTTTYKVIVTTNGGCADSAKVTVNVLPRPIANAGGGKKIFEGQSTTLNATASSADTYYWTPTTGLDNPNALRPVASPTDDITYTLHASSSYNCGMDTSSVFVKVYHKIVIPNSFSPNADGQNDFWNIEALETYPQSVTTVFNRYGQQVFKSTGYAKPWKGTYNGARLPGGTYYYVIDLKIGSPKLTGWVLIVN
ncbi:gliding motility-associated C-terminal domain-containing protein [Mucilaginibacter sp. FT3.2]|uniref:gliding motility-associated C-terminal domain-containing protein n=1 Tax=Mucilaginibacter sp. FT3.2 TaxID=2723090 RepID=UPI0016094A20|nr:gliding motility-associated C-terminal domain-containing protein [Mucilaginibacter sp. FT3.2]